MRIQTLIFAAILLLAAASDALADLTPQQRLAVLEEAQQLYDRGIEQVRISPAQARDAFRAAAERFQLVADEGVANGYLLYNLGNAYLQAGDVGRAILNYRRAEQYIAGDARLLANLDFARSVRRTQIEASGTTELADTILGWHERIPIRTRVFVFITSNIALWMALALGVLGALNLRGVVKPAVITAAVIWVLSGVSVAADLYGIGDERAGVLIADDVVVRKGNGHGFEPVFEQPLHAGVEFTVRSQRGEWLEISLPNGALGWVESEKAAPVN